MSREFIDAIASGDNLEAEEEFNNSISSKVGDALEVRRKELSQNFVGNNEVYNFEFYLKNSLNFASKEIYMISISIK